MIGADWQEFAILLVNICNTLPMGTESKHIKAFKLIAE